MLRDPHHERRLAAAADGEVSDHDDRHAGAVARREAHRIREATQPHGGTERDARRPEQPAQCRASVPVLREEIRGYRVAWVVKVICDRPAMREASMTRTTAWCVALASALITTTGSFRVPPARRISSANWSTLENATGAF